MAITRSSRRNGLKSLIVELLRLAKKEATEQWQDLWKEMFTVMMRQHFALHLDLRSLGYLQKSDYKFGTKQTANASPTPTAIQQRRGPCCCLTPISEM